MAPFSQAVPNKSFVMTSFEHAIAPHSSDERDGPKLLPACPNGP
jgi:hypothetical protein